VGGTGSLTIRTFVLGATPYVVVEMRTASDGSGDPALFLESGGGAEDEPLALPLLILMQHPAEGNPVAEMLRKLYRAGEARSSDWHRAIFAMVEQFNSDWWPFVQGVPETKEIRQ
jgi:succinyl-CoA synthetase beta subunit